MAAIAFILDTPQADIFFVDIDAENASGWTPLMCAVLSRQMEAALLLAARGADVNHRARCGATALALLEARTAVTAPDLWADACAQLVAAGARASELSRPLGPSGQQRLEAAVFEAAWRRRRHAVLARHSMLHEDS